MQIAILIAVLAALASVESNGEPVSGVGWRLLIMVGAALAAPLAALVAAWRMLPATSADGQSEQSLSRLQTAVIAVWLAGVAVVLYVAQWPRIVSDNWALAGWPLVDEIAVLLPVILPLLFIWAAWYRIQRAEQLAASRARNVAAPPARMLAHVWLNARHQLGLVLLPALVVVGTFESLAALNITSGNLDGAWWIGLPMLATMLLIMPAAVRWIWRTTPLPAGELRWLLEAICRARRCELRDILVWHTDGTLANAAVLGATSWLRYMLLTDALLTRLSANELAAVVRHEVGHLRRRHLPLRLALLALPLAVWLAIKHLWPGVEDATAAALEYFDLPTRSLLAGVLPLTMLAYAVLVVGWYSRLLEHDADIEACLNSTGQFDPDFADDFCHALIAVCGRRRGNRWAEWLHPPVTERLAFLHCLAQQPAQVAVFRRRLSWIGVGMAVLYLAALAAFLF